MLCRVCRIRLFRKSLRRSEASPKPSFFDCVGLKQLLPRTLGDVRDREQLERTIACARPHILLAAQARVGKAFYEAYATFTTYALGTLNVLEAVRMAESI
jgi:GDP-D-mannose dehydratase